jgi:hypothetical protein
MSAPAAAAVAALAWTPDFRRAVITKVVEAVSGDESKRAAVQSACGLQSGQSLATADEAIAAFDAAGWMAPERDLDELLTKLAAAGAYPASLTGYRWDWSCSSLQSLAAEATSRSKRVLDGIAALNDGAHTFSNTFGLLNSNDRIVDLWSTNVSFLGHVSADKAVRDAATELTKALSEFEVSQGMRVDLFQSLQKFADTAEGKALSGEAARFVEHTLRDFRRNGLALPLDKRTRIEEIKKRMSGLGIQFSKNLGEENTKYSLTREELKGVPEDQLARFEKDGDKFVVSLKYPDYMVSGDGCKGSRCAASYCCTACWANWCGFAHWFVRSRCLFFPLLCPPLSSRRWRSARWSRRARSLSSVSTLAARTATRRSWRS